MMRRHQSFNQSHQKYIKMLMSNFSELWVYDTFKYVTFEKDKIVPLGESCVFFSIQILCSRRAYMPNFIAHRIWYNQSTRLMNADAQTKTDSKISITIVSDLAWPWCYVGKRRLDNALSRFQQVFFLTGNLSTT